MKTVAFKVEKRNSKQYYQPDEISPVVEITERKTVDLLAEKLLPADEVLR